MPYTPATYYPTALKIFQWATASEPNPRLAAPVSSTATTLTFTTPPYDYDGTTVISGSFLMGVENSEGYVETIWVPAGAMSVDGLTATGVVRGVRLTGLDYTTGSTSNAVDLDQDSPVFCNVSAVERLILAGAFTGSIASGGTMWKIGKGQDDDIFVYAWNADANKPYFSYDKTTNQWIYSNDGTSSTPFGIGAGVTGRYGITVTAGDIDFDITDTVITKDARTGNEKRLVATKAADGYIDNTFIKESNVTQHLTKSFTTGENIATADAIRIKVDGLIYKAEKYPLISPWRELNAADDPSTVYKAACAIDTNKVVYIHETAGVAVRAFVVIWDGDVATTVGTAVTLGTGWSTSGYVDVCKVATDKFAVVHWADTAAGVDDGEVVICTVAGTTITAGTSVAFEGGTQLANSLNRICSPATDVIAIVWENADTGSDCYARVATIATRTPTFGAEVEISADNNSGQACDVAEIDTNKFVVAFKNTDNDLYAEVCTIAGTAITEGAATEIVDAITVTNNSVNVSKVATDKFMITYHDGSAVKMVVCSVSGTTITPGSPVTLTTENVGSNTKHEYVSDDKLILALQYSNGASYPPNSIKTYIVSVSGTVPTLHQMGDTYYLPVPSSWTESVLPASIINVNGDQFQVFAFESTGYDNLVFNFSDNRFIGFSEQTIAVGNPCIVNLWKDDNQSGLVIGAKYYLGANGVISLTGSVPAGIALTTTEILKQ